MDISNLTPQQIAAMMAQMQAQMAQQAQQAAPPPAPPPAPPQQFAPPPAMGVPGQYAPPPTQYAPPPVPAGAPAYAAPLPQGAQLPPQGQPASVDVITNLPPPSLPAGTYDFEVMFVERKSGVSDGGVAWENLRYKFTVLGGQLNGQNVIDSLSTKYTRPLFALAAACGKPIQQDGAFNVQTLNGCRVCAEVTYKGDYPRVGNFKPIAR